MHYLYLTAAVGFWLGWGFGGALYFDQPEASMMVGQYVLPGWFMRTWIFGCNVTLGPLFYMIAYVVRLWKHRQRMAHNGRN